MKVITCVTLTTILFLELFSIAESKAQSMIVDTPTSDCNAVNNGYSYDLDRCAVVTGKGFVNTAGGFLKVADSRTFPQLSNGRVALAHIVVKPGCIVQLHWHLQNDELVYVINGYGRVATVGVSAETTELFQVGPGNAYIFLQGFLHFVENTGSTDLQLVAAFSGNTIGTIADPNALLPIAQSDWDGLQILATLFGTSQDTIKALKLDKPLFVCKA